MTEFHQVLSAFSFSPLIDTPIFCSRGPILQVSPSLGVLEGSSTEGGEETLKRLGKNGVVVRRGRDRVGRQYSEGEIAGNFR